MSIKERLLEKKRKMQEQYQRGKQITEQMKAERLRKKANKLSSMKPGARKAISEGLATRSKPLDVMKREYERRKYEREQKYKK
jgi:epoxyqueuosine reductase QueG